MFKEKKLNKLVAAEIITAEQKEKILAFEEENSKGFLAQALTVLALFTIGLGVISLIAFNWDLISDSLKLSIMFFALLSCSFLVWFWIQEGKKERAERMLLALFFMFGAAIGLVIQIYQLKGGNFSSVLGVWCGLTLPQVLIAQKRYVAYFWVPLALSWFFYTYDFSSEMIMFLLLCFAGIGAIMERFLSKFSVGYVLKKFSFLFFYIGLAFYILLAGTWFDSKGISKLVIAALYLVALSGVFNYIKDYKGLRRNIKFAGLWVYALYAHVAGEIGLVQTGFGLILSGVLLLLMIKYWPKFINSLKMEKNDA